MEIRKGNRKDLEQVVILLRQVREEMDRKDWLYLDTEEEVFQQMDAGQMELWVAEEGQRLAACLYILHPGLEAYNYGYDLDFSQEELMKVVNMDTAVVHKDFRGQGLQRRLLETAEEAMRGRGTQILLCTIHPENRFSLNNALKTGYTIQKELPKYGSRRYLLRKDFLG